MNFSDFTDRLDACGAARRPVFFLVDFELRRPRIFDEADWGRAVHFSFPGGRSSACADMPTRLVVVRGISYPDFAAYRRGFDLLRQGLGRGDRFLVNYTQRVPIELDGSLSDVYTAATARYRVLLPREFVCFSPETFVTIAQDGRIATRPMKGTAPATERGRAELLASAKERAEHATVVDLLRNDLARAGARGVDVRRFRYVERIATAGGDDLWQTSSLIEGQLSSGWHGRLGSTLARLLPAGSVSGAPKAATLGLIRAAEQRPRGYYCGVAGFFDGLRLDSCVLIRYIEQAEGGYFFRSGGGITALSEAHDEYDEMRAKVRLPLTAAHQDPLPILRPA